MFCYVSLLQRHPERFLKVEGLFNFLFFEVDVIYQEMAFAVKKVLSQSFVWQFRLICYHCGYFMCYMFLSVWFLLVNIVTAFAFLWILDDFNPFLLVVMLFQISFFLYFLFPVFRISVKYVFVKSPIIITYHLLSSFLLPHIKGMITISFTGLL